MADETDLIRSRIDLVELVSERVALKRSGKNWKGLCPFHQDKNPSFHVNPSMGRYKCFSCGAGGDCFTWVMETERVEFPEALRELAKRAGIELTARSADPERVSKKEVYERAMAAAQGFFRAELARSKAATSYCDSRAIDKAVRDQWGLGFAPELGDALASHLKKEGFRLADCRELFLVDEDSGGGYYDRFRGRLMFPIFDERGRLVAFGGRLLGDGQPKYINSSDTPLYLKRRVLYGMNEAKDAMARSRQAILVEGYLDVIACHRAGLDNSVASLGTALSEEHAKLLSRWADEVMILYDSDEAGLNAADRAIPILESAGLRVRVCLIPSGKDPDMLLRAEGPEAVRALNAEGMSPLEFRLAQIESKLESTSDEFWKQVVSALSLCRNDLELTRHLLPLAIRYPDIRDPQAAQHALRSLVNRERTAQRNKPKNTYPELKDNPPPEKLKERLQISALHSAERALFAGLFSSQYAYSAWRACFDASNFLTGEGARIAASLSEAFADSPPEGDTMDWVSELPDDGTKEAISELAFEADRVNFRVEFEDAVALLKSRKEARAVVAMRSEGRLGDEELHEIHKRLLTIKQGDREDEES